MADEIGFVEALDALLGVDSREIVSAGQATLAMALNCLGFTSRPRYITPQFFEPRNLKFLVGDARNGHTVELGPQHFNEHKLGRTLDRIAAIGPDRVFLEVARRAFRKENVAVPTLHIDTTTHSFQGVYEDQSGQAIVGILGAESGEPTHVVVTHGYSKDHRMDCKQIVQELLVSSDGDVPLMMKAFSGNDSDSRIMQERIAQLKTAFAATNDSDLIPRYFVGDRKLWLQGSGMCSRVTPSVPLASLNTSKPVAHWKTFSRSPDTPQPPQRNCMTEDRKKSGAMSCSGS